MGWQQRCVQIVHSVQTIAENISLQAMKQKMRDEYLGFGGSPNNVRTQPTKALSLHLPLFAFF